MTKILLTYAVNDEHIKFECPKYEIKYICTGIGKVKAAVRLLNAFHTEHPDLVVNIGTAGTLHHQVGDIFVCYEFIDRDFQKVQLPGVDYKQNTTDLFEDKKGYLSWGPSGICNTGDSFLTEVTNMQGDVFDMEAYAQAWVCKEKKIPFLSVKYVTDIIGQNSIKHWENKLADARRALKKFVEKKLDSSN